jgi:hypothetical protein
MCAFERSQLVGANPSIVITTHDERVRFDQETACAIDVAVTIHDVANTKDAINVVFILQRMERCEQEIVFCVDVADQSKSHR